MKSIGIILITAVLLAGIGITPVMAQTQACGSTYIVQPGDFLAKIAQQCGISTSSLEAANPQIANPNLIFPFEVINIPGGTTGGSTGGSGGFPVTGGSFYLVKPGDSLFKIATRFGVSLDSVIDANPQIANPNVIDPGIRVTLPQGAKQVPTVSITPSIGRIGSIVTLDATGFSANVSVLVKFGPVGGTLTQLDRITTDAHGALYKQYAVPNLPAVVASNGPYEFSVALESNAGSGAVSNPITLTIVVPGTGTATYIVKPGDNMSRIALSFGLTLNALLAANPTIRSPFIIFPGEHLIIPENASIAASGAFVVVSPMTAKPGDMIQVHAGNFPANAAVDVRIGKQGQPFSAVVDAHASAQGVVTVQIAVPSAAKAGEQWVVTVVTTEMVNGLQVVSLPITIS